MRMRMRGGCRGETGRSYRLPTEAEWEYAARAGTTTAYPWEDAVEDAVCRNRANCSLRVGQVSGRTSPVGSFSANAWGLHDTVGNVWEWACSEYDAGYEGGELRCATGSGGFRVRRGGSWFMVPGNVRSAARHWSDAGTRYNSLGFRLAQD